MDNIKISVIVPVYKVEKYLVKCIDSIINQTYRNLEIILVDDGSPDDCGNICDTYAKKDHRIKVLHKKNGGLSSARNEGIKIATGDYIAFVDSDDWIDLDMYETLANLAIKYDADIVEGGFRFYRPWKNENKILDCKNTGEISIFSNVEALEKLYFGTSTFNDIVIMVWNKIYKADILKDCCFSEGYIYEDAEFTPKAIYKANKIIKIDKSFYNYNIHLSESSTSGMKKNIFTVKSDLYIKKQVVDFFESVGLSKFVEYTKALRFNGLFEAYYNLFVQRKQNLEYQKYLKLIKEEIYKYKEEIISNKYMGSIWKYKLFYLSSSLWCYVKSAYKKFNTLKYKIKVRITGKN